MATIVIQLDPRLLLNPDADIRYLIPDLLIEKSAGLLKDDGYDYLDGDDATPLLQVYLRTDEVARALPETIRILNSERVLGNDLSTLPIAVEDHESFEVVYPKNFSGVFPRPREFR